MKNGLFNTQRKSERRGFSQKIMYRIYSLRLVASIDCFPKGKQSACWLRQTDFIPKSLLPELEVASDFFKDVVLFHFLFTIFS
jgi:hypothetical protein